MEKLTPAQRKLNKQATKLRDLAFMQRREVFLAERDFCRAAIEAGPLGVASREAAEQYNHTAAECAAEMSALDAEIQALMLKRTALEHQHKLCLKNLGEAKNVAMDSRNRALHEAECRVKEKYADVAGRLIASTWKHYREFFPLVDGACSTQNPPKASTVGGTL